MLTAKAWHRDREVWKRWADSHQTGLKTVRQKGCHTPNYKLQSQGMGSRRSGERGYLGKTDHNRAFVQTT
eukprot:16188769-Heterocapsa_arctica.AAC.1